MFLNDPLVLSAIKPPLHCSIKVTSSLGVACLRSPFHVPHDVRTCGSEGMANLQHKMLPMPQLLFVDFDGVLHPTSAQPSEHFSQMYLLEEALDGTECGIVISSSWRHQHSLQDLTGMFPMSLRSSIRGTTGGPYIGRWSRYNEILHSVQRYGARTQWRALDDSWNEFPKDCVELIACNPSVGFGREQAQQVRRWLLGGVSVA